MTIEYGDGGFDQLYKFNLPVVKKLSLANLEAEERLNRMQNPTYEGYIGEIQNYNAEDVAFTRDWFSAGLFGLRKERDESEPWDYRQATGTIINVEGANMNFESGVNEYGDEDLRNELDRREKQALADKKMGMLDAYGEDVYTNGQVFTFNKRFGTSDVFYQYVVLRTNDVWYITGKDAGKQFTWKNLVLFCLSGPHPVDVEDFVELVPKVG
jgi:hypothetical protein